MRNAGQCARGHHLGASDFRTDHLGYVVPDCAACATGVPPVEIPRETFVAGARPGCALRRDHPVRGVVCQIAFERAYAQYGYPAPFARAVLLAVLATGKPSLVPRVVREYLVQAPEARFSTPVPIEVRCIGCSVTAQALAELQSTYRTVLHPEVDKALLAHHRQEVPGPYTGTDVPVVSAADAAAWEELVASGALDADDCDALGALSREDWL